MKKTTKKPLLFILIFIISAFIITTLASTKVVAASKATMTRQGDTIWFGYYPQTKATDEELANMSAEPDADGYYTSGKDKFVKVNSANPKYHSETADSDYIPFDDETAPVVGATYYFKVEAIEWKVMVDDEEANTVKLVSKKYIDTHCWLSSFENGGYWADYYNTLEGVPENTNANGWRYSEMRAWLNDTFLNTAFSEEEQKSIYLFANRNTIDYKKDDETTIVYDYIAVGNRDDYDAAGDDGRPTDYTIVKGATWCYNKDHVYYYVNANYPSFPNDTVRLYRHDEHNKCTTADSVEAVRPIMYVNRSDAKILTSQAKKAQNGKNAMIIIGVVGIIVGGGLAIPMMISTSKKQKVTKQETGHDYKLTKKETAILTPGLVLLICGIVLIVLRIMLFGGLGGKLQPGIYRQESQYAQSGNAAQVGYTAFRINGDGTFDFTDYYQGAGTAWSGHGTYSISGKTITFNWNANPMYPNGHTSTGTIKSSTSFGDASSTFKLIE